LSQLSIQQYLNNLAKLRQVSGTTRESVVREAFKDLLKGWARDHDLTFVSEYQIETKTKDRRYADGALLHTLRVPFGYWEAKDTEDDLDAEIEKKFRAGYPRTNIIFEDSTQAVLIQHGEEIFRCQVEDTTALGKLLSLFFGYERPEIEAFRKAVDQFKLDLPNVLDALRTMISDGYQTTPKFRDAAGEFLRHAQEAINPNLVDADVREMLIQHVLTGEVFAAVFPGTTFHEDNNVARELQRLESTFFTGNTKFQTLKGLEPYYAAIRKAAAQISTHQEKQTFLKAIYENFYKVYNPKAADRLGVVYTPSEIVRFMIETTDLLCERYFRRNLIDNDVNILDPASGTGTFVCEIIDHFAGQPVKLSKKYLEGLYANEVAILPYYVANLNIEATFAAATGRYEEFPGLCFVDTLDNTFALRKHRGHMDSLFGSLSDDNVKRIRTQNSRTISVIIGNPPYNANQLNENENNKNREYPEIDKRIKETYIAESQAQKTKVYDMYARFFRWASDRLDENGVIAFITNRSFINSRTFDGFRSVVAKEFNEILILDLGGDVRANPKLSGTTHNVFGIQTGVAISFLVRKAKNKECRIFYSRRPELETAEDKLAFLAHTKLQDIGFEKIKPDKNHNWINLADTDFDSLLPLATKAVKATKKAIQARAIFKTFSLGLVTARDSWLVDFDQEQLKRKVDYFCKVYEKDKQLWSSTGRPKDTGRFVDRSIKWTSELEKHMTRGTKLEFQKTAMARALYRPFVSTWMYYAEALTHRRYQMPVFFPNAKCKNRVITFLSVISSWPLAALATDRIFDYCLLKQGNGATQSVALWTYDKKGQRQENITDWAVQQFEGYYSKLKDAKVPITKEAIFHYVYAVLHDPEYRNKYALDLKRELPRIPFYPNFKQWSEWGRALMDIHLNYESATPLPLKRLENPNEKTNQTDHAPKPVLRVQKQKGLIILDTATTLSGVPDAVWNYRLANRSAIEWVLDQYREKQPKDLTVRELFNTYRFSDYKEEVIELLKRVAKVSVETMKIVAAMTNAPQNVK
jgi:predicted helicase